LIDQNGQPNPDQATATQQEAGVPGGNLLGWRTYYWTNS
jgi:hypothetical protein